MLTYLLDVGGTGEHCRVRLLGEITEDNVRSMLERLWSDPQYSAHTAALWDVSGCTLPDLNTLMRMAEFIAKRKRGRGPRVLAFVAPAFGETLVARTFRGFERLVKLNLNFFPSDPAAVAWLEERSRGPG